MKLLYINKWSDFEIARAPTLVVLTYKNLIYVDQDDYPIGFKPTMSKTAIISKRRDHVCQRRSFELMSYYISYKRLPWQMDVIEYLLDTNIAEAREITLKLHDIDLTARKLI